MKTILNILFITGLVFLAHQMINAYGRATRPITVNIIVLTDPFEDFSPDQAVEHDV